MFEVVMNRRADYGMREIDFFFFLSRAKGPFSVREHQFA